MHSTVFAANREDEIRRRRDDASLTLHYMMLMDGWMDGQCWRAGQPRATCEVEVSPWKRGRQPCQTFFVDKSTYLRLQYDTVPARTCSSVRRHCTVVVHHVRCADYVPYQHHSIKERKKKKKKENKEEASDQV
jgi:hypothetical protein